MKLLPEIEKALNNQITLERYASTMYYQMSYFFYSVGLAGFAEYLENHAIEELEHAKKIADYIMNCDSYPRLQALPAPEKTSFSSPLEIFQTVLEIENRDTASIYVLYELALDHKDRCTQIFLHWFINEQIEEEGDAYDMIRKLQLIGGDKGALLEIDEEL